MTIKLPAYVAGAALVVCLLAASSHAQLPTYDPTGVTALQSCPSNVGFYSDQNNQPTCYTGAISCPNTAAITAISCAA
jgi:hypothetical protein